MNELISQLVQQLGVEEGQAKGGAGAVLKLAQEKLGGDFSKVAQAIPGAGDLIKSAPESGGAAKMLGGLMSAVGGAKAGDLASLAGSFAQLKLDPGMIGKFVPVILSFVQSKAGQDVVALLAKALQK
jgi:hypothetical protein